MAAADTQRAREAAMALASELAEAGSLASKYVRISEDQMEEGHFSLRLRLPTATLHPQMMAALGERGYWVEYLGERGAAHVFLIKTDGAVHEGVY